MNTTNNADAGKNVLWPGATPYFGASNAPKSLRASGVAPGHGVCTSQANFQAIPRPHSCQFLPERIDGAHMHDPESNRGERPHASTETARTHDRPARAIAIGSWLALLPSIAFALVLARRTRLEDTFLCCHLPLCRVCEQRAGKTLANQETEEERVCQTFRVNQSRRLSRQILVLTVGHVWPTSGRSERATTRWIT
jgi:hypothetical protein